MRRKIKLSETDIKNLVSIVIEQEEEQWVKVTPEKYLEIMKFAGYNSLGVSKIPEFRNKKIWITGSLNLDNTPTKSLSGVYRIDGSLSIRHTQISDLSHVVVKGNTWDSGTPIEKKRLAKIRRQKIQDAQERREDEYYDLEKNPKDTEALAANAILEYLRDEEKVDVRTKEDNKRIDELKKVIENLERKEEEGIERGENVHDIYLDRTDAEVELEELEEKIDVYNLIPSTYTHYGLPMFELVSEEENDGNEYCAGTPYEMEEAALEYAKGMVNEGLDSFDKNFVRNHIDTEKVVDYFRDFYDSDVRDNPEVYFDDDDYSLSDEQEKRLEEIDALIDVLNNRLEEIEQEIEEPSDYRKAYDEIQNRIDTLESEKEDIEPEVGEPTEEMIDDKVEELLDNVRDNPMYYLEDFGFTNNLDEFIDIDELVQDVVNQDGVGIINSYDGDYSVVYVNGEEYYVMRLN